MSITRYSPFALADFGFPFKALSDDFSSVRPWVPAVDILEDENQLLVKADLPDVDM